MALSSAQQWRSKLIVGSTVYVTCRGTVTEVDKDTNKILIRYDGFANEGWWERNAKHLTETSAVDAQTKLNQLRLTFLNLQKQLEEKDTIIAQCNQQLRGERTQYKKLQESYKKMQQQIKNDVDEEIGKLKQQLARKRSASRTSHHSSSASYTRDQMMVILLCTSKPKHLIKPRDEIGGEQKSVHASIVKHEQNMALWEKFTHVMNKKFDDYQTELQQGKKTTQLLTYFVHNKRQWQQQQNNMELVTEHLQELYESQRKLKSSIGKHEKNASGKYTEYDSILSDYEQSKGRRTELEKELKQKLKELNTECESENKLNETQCALLDEYNTLDVELSAYKSLLDKCKAQIHKYRDFDPTNDERIQQMQLFFYSQWSQYMRVWYKWEAESIICWLKYLRERKQLVLSYDVDLEKILKNMKADNMDGAALLTVDKEGLRSVGFEVLNDRREIYDEIRKLVSRYPENGDAADDDEDGAHKAPKEFLCPLSNEIMKQPVQIFDGYTYEQSVIEQYLNQNKKSPVTNEPCDDDDICFTPNRKLKQKIDAYLAVNAEV